MSLAGQNGLVDAAIGLLKYFIWRESHSFRSDFVCVVGNQK